MPPPPLLPLDESTRLQASSRIVSCNLDGEAVLLDPQAGFYYGLNDVGAAIWAALATPSNLADLCEVVVAQFDVDEDACRDDVRQLAEDLLARGLVVVPTPA